MTDAALTVAPTPVEQPSIGPTVAEQPPVSEQLHQAPEKKTYRPIDLPSHELDDAANEDQFNESMRTVAVASLAGINVESMPSVFTTRAQEGLEAAKFPLQGLSLEHGLKNLAIYLESGTGKKIREQLTELPREERQIIFEELLGQILRGNVSGEGLAIVLGGGITKNPDLKNPSQPGLKEVQSAAHFHPAHATKEGIRPASIELGTIPEGMDLKYLIRHELAHAYLMARVPGGLIYRTEDQARLLHLQKVPAPGDGQTNRHRPMELHPVETRIYEGALFGGLREQVRRFESPYINHLFDQLSKDSSPKMLAFVLNEMQAERGAVFMSSDGSLADFLLKRLEFSQLLKLAGEQPDVDMTKDPSGPLAAQLEAVLLEAKDKGWGYEDLAPKLQEFGKQLQLQGLSDFLLETVILHKRLHLGLRGEQHKPISAPDNTYHPQLLAILKGETGPANNDVWSWDDYASANDLNFDFNDFSYDDAAMASSMTPRPSNPKQKTLLQSLANGIASLFLDPK